LRNIKAEVAYDGSGYYGFQVQRRDGGELPTVQARLLEAVARVTGEDTIVIGAGRTDAGVHARGQVVNFRVFKSTIPGTRFAYALNRYLPSDIVVRHSVEVPESFHAQFDAVRKLYRYFIYNDDFPCPLWRNYSYFESRPLEAERMAAAAALLEGEHDFSSFASTSPGNVSGNRVRTLFKSKVYRKGRLVVYSVMGSGFLYKMVRGLAGTLLEVGLGKITPADVLDILGSRQRTRAGPNLPAKGLVLERVMYM